MTASKSARKALELLQRQDKLSDPMRLPIISARLSGDSTMGSIIDLREGG
jgi:hypothetical protein